MPVICSYFKQAELKDMFQLDDPAYSATQRWLSSQHPVELGLDPTVVSHFEDLGRLGGVAGLNRHDQLYSNSKMTEESGDGGAEMVGLLIVVSELRGIELSLLLSTKAAAFLRSHENEPPATSPRARVRKTRADAGPKSPKVSRRRNVVDENGMQPIYDVWKHD